MFLKLVSIPLIISVIILAGNSKRGLSSVKIISSAYWQAIFAISGLFPVSLSPPQPKTSHSFCLFKCNLTAFKIDSKASGV